MGGPGGRGYISYSRSARPGAHVICSAKRTYYSREGCGALSVQRFDLRSGFSPKIRECAPFKTASRKTGAEEVYKQESRVLTAYKCLLLIDMFSVPGV